MERNLNKLFEEVLTENFYDFYQDTIIEFDETSELFSQYFNIFMPKEDKAPGSSRIHISEALSPRQEQIRENLLKNISVYTASITNRIRNLYNNFMNIHIDKNIADGLTRQLIEILRHSDTTYDLYLQLHGKDDPNLLEVQSLFKGFIDQSKILDAILHSKNEKDQNADNQLEVIYTEDGQLNIGIL
jgi:uncharacterized protein YdiU (UPF0061 family)